MRSESPQSTFTLRPVPDAMFQCKQWRSFTVKSNYFASLMDCKIS